MALYTNSDGLVQFYGPRTTTDYPVARKSITDGGNERVIELDVEYNHIGSGIGTFLDQDSNLNGSNDSFSNSHAYIPANAVITDVKFYVKTAFTSGGAATLDVGLYAKAGGAIDADGLIAAQAVAGLTAGTCITGAGALATNDNVGSSNAYIGMTYGTAAFTAGSGRLVVRYVPQRP
jgi:hypothetical protein